MIGTAHEEAHRQRGGEHHKTAIDHCLAGELRDSIAVLFGKLPEKSTIRKGDKAEFVRKFLLIGEKSNLEASQLGCGASLMPLLELKTDAPKEPRGADRAAKNMEAPPECR